MVVPPSLSPATAAAACLSSLARPLVAVTAEAGGFEATLFHAGLLGVVRLPGCVLLGLE